RAVASGIDTKLQLDTDGTANGANWVTIARLDGVHAGNSVNVILSASAPAGVTITVVAATDSFDSDNRGDILWQNDNGTAAIWLMDGINVKSIGATQPNVNPQWHVKGAADFNGDGKADILWQHDDGTPSIWLMNGTNLLQVSPQMPNPGAAWHAKS